MEEDSYKQIVKKALSIGFVVLYEEWISKGRFKYHWYDDIPTFPLDKQHYFYNPTLGNFYDVLDHIEYNFEEVKSQNHSLGTMFAPMIEAGCSRFYEPDKVIIRNRLYIRSDYFDSQEILVRQSDAFIKQYNSLVRAVKKLAPMRDTERGCEYMTDYMFKCYQDGYGVRG